MTDHPGPYRIYRVTGRNLDLVTQIADMDDAFEFVEARMNEARGKWEILDRDGKSLLDQGNERPK